MSRRKLLSAVVLGVVAVCSAVVLAGSPWNTSPTTPRVAQPAPPSASPATVSGSAPGPTPSVTETSESPSSVAVPTQSACSSGGDLVSLSIPSVGIDDTLSPQGLNAQGELEPPPRNTIWYTGSPLPGKPGVSVIAGHDEWSGPSNFWNLDEVQKGALVYVKCKGETQTWQVTSSYSKLKTDAQHDTSVWNLDGKITSPELVVITCDKHSPVVNHHHLNNFVVHATLVSVSHS